MSRVHDLPGGLSPKGTSVSVKCSILERDYLVLYAHLKEETWHFGDRVRSGVKIGDISRKGHTHGLHVHIDVTVLGQFNEPVQVAGRTIITNGANPRIDPMYFILNIARYQ